MAKKIPSRCPNCKKHLTFRLLSQGKSGFSGGKAVLGAVLFGPIGLAAGALGKKEKVFQCKKCGYTV